MVRGQFVAKTPWCSCHIYAVARRVAASYARRMARAADDGLPTEPTSARARQRACEPDLPLTASGKPDLAEQADEHLAGFGEQ